MAVFPAGFSERVFEFSFNAEFCDRNRAILAAAPEIPTQNEEKWLGYDVALQLNQRGGAMHSVALQHKVARFVDGRSPSNATFWDAVGGAYFAFVIDADQFNLLSIVAGAGLPGVEVYYCAPLYTSLQDMNVHYLGSTVPANAVWIDIAGVGEIDSGERHTMVVAASGTGAYVCSSEPRKLKTINPVDHARPKDSPRITLDRMRQIYEIADAGVREYWPRRKAKAAVEDQSFRLPERLPSPQQIDSFGAALTATGILLSNYYGLTWMIETAK